jgi:hypothetical protein
MRTWWHKEEAIGLYMAEHSAPVPRLHLDTLIERGLHERGVRLGSAHAFGVLFFRRRSAHALHCLLAVDPSAPRV